MRDDAVREKLAAALLDYGVGRSTAPRLADALLPVVRDIAAEELREAADGLVAGGGHVPYARWLRERADALTKPPDGPVR